MKRSQSTEQDGALLFAPWLAADLGKFSFSAQWGCLGPSPGWRRSEIHWWYLGTVGLIQLDSEPPVRNQRGSKIYRETNMYFLELHSSAPDSLLSQTIQHL